MLGQLFGIKPFTFPYTDFKFPGQHSEEKILFVTRESEKMLYLRLALIGLVSFIFLAGGLFALNTLAYYINSHLIMSLKLTWLIITLIGAAIAAWWTITLWKKSVFIVTTRRLTKIIYTTPWNKYHLSLTLDKIVDGGAYKKGLLQPLLGLGYFVARSSAGNIKNFKIINIDFAEDLHNYITKLLYTFTNQKDKLDNFRPFIPYMKGEARRRFAPEYYQ